MGFVAISRWQVLPSLYKNKPTNVVLFVYVEKHIFREELLSETDWKR